MNKLTIILNCIIHIILVLIFEGIFLFVVLYPLLNKLSNRYLAIINNYIYSILYPDDYYNLNYYINEKHHFHCYTNENKCCKIHKHSVENLGLDNGIELSKKLNYKTDENSGKFVAPVDGVDYNDNLKIAQCINYATRA
mgnify:CR=1 FL=1